MWWINVFVFLFLMAVIFRAIEWLLQKIPSEIETKHKIDLPVKQSKEAGAAKKGTLIKRKRVMESENSAKRKSAKSETSKLKDEQSYGKSLSVTKTDWSQISRVMESENSAKRKSAISETSELTDAQLYGKSMSVTKAEWSQISSDYISEETEICKDKKGVVLESIQDAKTCYDKSNSSIKDLECDKFRSFVDEKVLKREMETLGVLHGLNKYINDSFDKWTQRDLNVAVSGNSGVGKSSLINALRKLKPSDDRAAAVGVVETTTEGCHYTYPDHPNVTIWDLPGLGTQKFSKDEYLEDMNFARFDVVLIVSAGRFLENDIWLGKELRDMRKNIIFVRTKIDIDLMNAKRDHPYTFSEKVCLDKIKCNLSDAIREGGLPASVTGVYLVSSPKREKYDFIMLDKKLKDMLSFKGKAIRSILQQNVQVEITKNQQMNKNGFGFQKALSILFGFVPTQALTETLCQQSLSNIRTTCQQKFCIDDTSLDKTANELKTSSKRLKGKLKSYKTFLFKPPDFFSKVIPNTKYSIPVFGMLFSAHNSYVTTTEKINAMCDKMAEDELNLAILRLDRLEGDLKPIK